MSRELRQPERRIKAKRLKYNKLRSSSSGDINLPISSSCTFLSNAGDSSNLHNKLSHQISPIAHSLLIIPIHADFPQSSSNQPRLHIFVRAELYFKALLISLL
ncbi:unnamed protein product [Protopolystoma xenopodis]|uniref:Uncharacterized protein n=1 Tax=Protopolystoma xenopodis TaxID=117903 RepID=A0A3S5A697_9PLAT|nr:unnamed protein product [Protopolystoma xenopodis]